MNEKMPEVKISFYTKYIKRFFDVILSSVAIIIFSPVFLFLILLELIIHGRPVIYSQERPGLYGKIFKMYKFRSMTNERDEHGKLLSEDKRITKFGKIIRRLSLDELPELINIIKGDMSIIGPRPLLIEYLPLYSARHAMRHFVKPGLACVRIISSDSKTWTWREQFENDIFYIEHISFFTDVRMILAVVKEVLKGSEYRTSDTRVPFNGKNLDETRSKQDIDIESHFDSERGGCNS